MINDTYDIYVYLNFKLITIDNYHNKTTEFKNNYGYLLFFIFAAIHQVTMIQN